MSLNFTAIRGFKAPQSVITAAPFTVVAWIKPTTISAAYRFIAGIQGAATNQLHALVTNNTTVRARSVSGASSREATCLASLVVNNWRACAAVFDITSNTDRLADCNAATPGTETTNITPSGIANIFIGSLDATLGFAGEIDQVAFWNVALTAEERDQLGCSDASFFGYEASLVRPSNLIWQFDLNDPAGPTLIAGSGGPLTWTLQGAGSVAHGAGIAGGAFYERRSGYAFPESPAAPTFNAAWAGATHLVGAGVVG